jgi:hypothetical protein
MKKWIKSRLLNTLLGLLLFGAATAALVPLITWLVDGLAAWLLRQDKAMVDPLVLVLPLLLGAIVMGAMAVSVTSISRRRGRWLDELFAPLGLAGRPYGLTGRQYHGRYQGRQIDAYIYHGPGLLLYVGAETATRLAATAEDQMVPQLAQLFNGPPLQHTHADLEGTVIFAHDHEWARAWVAHTAIRDALRRLIHEPTGFVFQRVHIRPGAVFLHLHRGVSLRQVMQQAHGLVAWVEDLMGLAEAAERLPAPAEQLAAAGWEERLQPANLNPRLLIGIVAAGVLLPLICVGVAMVLYSIGPGGL